MHGVGGLSFIRLRTFCCSVILFLPGHPKSEHRDSAESGSLYRPHFPCTVQNPHLGLGCLAWEWRMRLGGGRGRFGSQGKPCQVFQEAVFGRSQVAQSRLPGCPSQTKESKHGQRDAVERKKLQQVRVPEARASRKETSRAKRGTGPPPLLGRPLSAFFPSQQLLQAPALGSCLQPTRLAPHKSRPKDPPTKGEGQRQAGQSQLRQCE